MDINIGEEKIVALISPFALQVIEDRARSKRVDAFGQLVKFMQRPKPEDVQVTKSELRYEPFWYGAARAIYKYDRRHRYEVQVAPEVQAVTLYENEHVVQTGRAFQIEGMEHCAEDIQREMFLDPRTGAETDYRKYLGFPKREIENLEALQTAADSALPEERSPADVSENLPAPAPPKQAGIHAPGAIVIVPEIRSSFLVGKLTQALMKVIQADTIHEQHIDVEQITLYYRPVYAFEFLWQGHDKRSVLLFDGMTGETRTEPGQIKQQIVRVLDNDDLFDIGADAVGTFVPGANIAVKLGRLAARKALK